MRRRAGWLLVLGLASWGCGPPQAVPMLPPGYVAPPVSSTDGGMEAEGEVKSRGVMQQYGNASAQPSTAVAPAAPQTGPGKKE